MSFVQATQMLVEACSQIVQLIRHFFLVYRLGCLLDGSTQLRAAPLRFVVGHFKLLLALCGQV